ncbi:MAG TPA: hypothetical protein VN790_03865 [Steroidobacteraceae bacterium]|nr:hypothetical protein [Steroidobacteraceae bacterium]
MKSKWIISGLLSAAVWTFAGPVLADDLPFKEGPVTDVTSVRTKPGKFFEYWAFLAKDFKADMDEAKKQGLVVSYSVQAAIPRSPHDPDLYLVVTYPNMAAFDTLNEKMNAIAKKLRATSPQQEDKASGDRESLREILGDQIIRELQFK